MSDRKYPDIEFVETDTETIESNLIALYENMVQQVPGREALQSLPGVTRKAVYFMGGKYHCAAACHYQRNCKRTCHAMRTVNTWTVWQNCSRIWKGCQQVRRLQCSASTYRRRRHNQ